VKDPALQVDFVTAGMVGDVTVSGGLVRVGIKLTTPACPSREVIRQSIQEAVADLPDVTAVEVDLGASTLGRTTNPQNPRLPGVKNIIVVAAGKGGVGKSTVATNLAAALMLDGARVGLLDADVYGPSIPQMMGDPDVSAGGDDKGNISPAVHHGMPVISVGFFVEKGGAVIWRGPMVGKLLQQFLEQVTWGELDYLVVDMPPGTGDAQLSMAQLIPITGAVMVTTPQEVSIIDVEKAIAMWRRVEVPWSGVVENMSGYVCPSCGHHDEIFSRGGGRTLAEREKVAFLGEVPINSSIRGGGDAGKPIVLAAPTLRCRRCSATIARTSPAPCPCATVPTKRGGKLPLIR
jgi:ATP-binding protein involved in chromosome partitioning